MFLFLVVKEGANKSTDFSVWITILYLRQVLQSNIEHIGKSDGKVLTFLLTFALVGRFSDKAETQNTYSHLS